MVNVDCSRAGPGELSLEAALDSPPASPASSLPGRPGRSQLLPSGNSLAKHSASRSICTCCCTAKAVETACESSRSETTVGLLDCCFCAGVQAKTEVLDNKDGTHTVTYVPLTSGMYTLLLKYGGKPVPGFPAKVMVDPAVDTSKVKVFGPGLEGQGSVFPSLHRDATCVSQTACS